jgi:hypothetical protein
MSKLAEARAEAARLFVEQRLSVAEIAARMDRSEEGVELLLTYGGIDPRAELPPFLASAPQEIAPAAAGEEPAQAAPEPIPPLVAAALLGARDVVGASEATAAADYPRQVRVLAGAALARAKLMKGPAAAQACAVGAASSLCPSQWAKAGVTAAMVEVVTAYVSETPEALATTPVRRSRLERMFTPREDPEPDTEMVIVEAGGCAPPIVVGGGHLPEVQIRPLRVIHASHALGSPRAATRAPNPVAGRKLRFIRRFLDANWRVAEVAHLFDVEPSDITEALGATA